MSNARVATRSRPRPGFWRSAARVWIPVFVVYVAFRSFAWQPFNVPSPSMYPTLRVGDYEFVSKWDYGYGTASLPWGAPPPDQGRMFGRTPARSDLVVFRWPPNQAEAWVKRVVALPGETVTVRNGIPEIAGQPRTTVSDPGLSGRCWGGHDHDCRILLETLPGTTPHQIAIDPWDPSNRDYGPVTVPEGMLFVMGDNRDHSVDSRVAQAQGGAGLVPIADLIGRVAVVAFNRYDPGRRFVVP